MSRTTRRTRSHLITVYVGPKDEFLKDAYNRQRAAAKGLTVEKLYQQRLCWFHGDSHSGRFSVPRWYRQLHGAHAMRRVENHRLQHSIREDLLEQHLPESRARNRAYDCWW